MKYRKLPVVIETELLEENQTSLRKVLDFIGQEVDTTSDMAKQRWDEYFNMCLGSGGLVIHTLEGYVLASWGDYVIKGVKGEFYPCKPDVFKMTYESAESESDSK